MRLAAISTSSKVGSVALAEGASAGAGRIVAERSFDSGMIHGRALLPALSALLSERGWSPRDVEAVGVDVGPGSYTGCRVGVTAAKILARGTGARLAGIPSLAAIAWALRSEASGAPVAVALDARRGRVYGGIYRAGAAGIEPLRGTEVEEAGRWAAIAAAHGPDLLWAGDALAVDPETFAGRRRAAPERWIPTAAAVAELALARLDQGEADDPYRLEPLYLEPTEAERKLDGGAP